MNLTIEKFDDFINNRYPTQCVYRNNANGGTERLTIEDIDTLVQAQNSDSATVSGLQQDTFEYFIGKYGARFKGLRFCYNKLIHDWSPLAKLTSLEYLEMFSNHGMTRLWDMSSNDSLKALAINCAKLHSVEGVEKAPSLRRFEIGESLWRSTVLDSLMLLAGTKIEYLNFTGKKIEDNDLSFLCKMPALRHFDFPTNLFTTEQVAWMVAKFPALEGYALCAKIDILGYNEITKKMDVPSSLIVGKRKPLLVNKGNEEKIQRYIDQFNQLVEYYKGVEKP